MKKKNFANDYIAFNFKNLPKNSASLRRLEEKLSYAGSTQQAKLHDMKLKNPRTTFLLSLFNLDRFYNGQPILGMLKIITLGGFGVWTLVDLFLSPQKTREDNLNRLLDLDIEPEPFVDTEIADSINSSLAKNMVKSMVKDQVNNFLSEDEALDDTSDELDDSESVDDLEDEIEEPEELDDFGDFEE